MHVSFYSSILIAFFASPVFAQTALTCGSDTVVNVSTIIGNTVCVGSTGNWEAQEYHSGASGVDDNLIDYKKGNDAVDPTGPVGMWTNSGSNIITYTYGGLTYPTIYCEGVSGTYFKNQNESKLVDHIVSGQGSCD